MGPAVCCVHLSLVDRIDHTRAPYHHKLLVPHSHLGPKSSLTGKTVCQRERARILATVTSSTYNVGSFKTSYPDLVPWSLPMAKIWVRCLESLARPLKTRKGHFDLMLQHCNCYRGTIYCPFKVLTSKISVRLFTPIGSFQKLFVVSVRHFCNKKVLMNKNIFLYWDEINYYRHINSRAVWKRSKF